MKERMKTVSVALVLCLNVGVDPPDVVKTNPCSRIECWIDPLAMSAQKSLEAIGSSLQHQYERWQPRARYKQSLDPTVDLVKKLCISLRRNAKEERVLFHYNGHGVPRPTENGEIWVFNQTYTQYIPLSVYDLQTWMGSPSIYVYDCSSAGVIIESFKQFSAQREQEYEANQLSSSILVKNCIQLAACGVHELLPMNPELPADLFTACLTTPIKIALKWYVLQKNGQLVPGITTEKVEELPGQLNDRRTMLGELNWIFTAITDTIAWNTLPHELFQKLFRQDLLVASLFRNFLLAERIMRSYNCTPISCPELPPTFQHSMWRAWDMALDLCLSQLLGILNEGQKFQYSPFFAEQLTAFQVWLEHGSEKRNPPEQLPIVLQVLLSQIHRLRALDLLGRFLDLGPWAVSLALSVGIFPYVLKLLQASAQELRPLLVFIWSKILAVDNSCQADLVKDNGHKYFITVLSDVNLPAEHRTMAAFVLTMIVNNYLTGQEVALQDNLVCACLVQFSDPSEQLRQWLALCLAKLWSDYDEAKWCGVRDSAHEKLYDLLTDPVPEVRAAVVYALGCFISKKTNERSKHADNIDHGVGMKLITIANDGSALVRKELVVALHGLVIQFETQFAAVAFQMYEEEKNGNFNNTSHDARFHDSRRNSESLSQGFFHRENGMSRSLSSRTLRNHHPMSPTIGHQHGDSFMPGYASGGFPPIKRASSSSSVSSLLGSYSNVYMNIWRVLYNLSKDPDPGVSGMSSTVVNHVQSKIVATKPRFAPTTSKSSSSQSAPNSPSNRPASILHHEQNANSSFTSSSPPTSSLSTPLHRTSPSHTPQHLRRSSTRGHDRNTLFEEDVNESEATVTTPTSPLTQPLVSTGFFDWCCRQFSQPAMRVPDHQDPESHSHHEQCYRLLRAESMQHSAASEQEKAGFSRLDEKIFLNRNPHVPTVIKFHPFEPHLAVADKEGVSIWDWEESTKVTHFFKNHRQVVKTTALEFINTHHSALVLTGSDDGAVRIWRNYNRPNGSNVELVSSWLALPNKLPIKGGSGLVADWEQRRGLLFVSGDSRSIRVWDTQSELQTAEFPSGCDCCVTSLAHEPLGDVLVAGCADGSVRLYDRRLPSHSCRVLTTREHKSWVVKVTVPQHLLMNKKIISASHGGDVRFWDIRMTESLSTINTLPNVTAFDVHPYADVLTCGSSQQCIGVYNQAGDKLSMIRHHDGFMGQRIGPVTCLTFHPYKVRLATGSLDAYIAVYSIQDSRRK